jgi:hypothetical protein
MVADTAADTPVAAAQQAAADFAVVVAVADSTAVVAVASMVEAAAMAVADTGKA